MPHSPIFSHLCRVHNITTTILLSFLFAVALNAQDTTKVAQAKKKPSATYQVGAARITVWENKTKYNTYRNFMVEKIYTKNGEERKTKNFDERELFELKEVIDQAIAEERKKATNK